MSAATPITTKMATKPTPMSSPNIIHIVRRIPTVIPKVSAKVMHMPGVTETKKKVGIKAKSKALLINLVRWLKSSRE